MVDKDNGEFLAVHEEVVKKVLETLPDEEELYDLAELFKVFGDSTRIRILHALFESELCVGDIAQILNLSQSAVSHQWYRTDLKSEPIRGQSPTPHFKGCQVG